MSEKSRNFWQNRKSSILEKKRCFLEQCKGVHCVYLGECFQTHIYLQILVLTQPRTSPVKFTRSPNECSVAGCSPRVARADERRSGKLYRARSRLYRSQILQVNTRWKALAEIYTMHSFAPLSNLKISVKNC